MDDDLMPGVHPRSINAEDEPMTPVSYEAGLIVLSFVVSVIGCITTVELLQRRTSTKGLYNWYGGYA
jgi:NO-binding membrane sensor protein with MHYT domain